MPEGPQPHVFNANAEGKGQPGVFNLTTGRKIQPGVFYSLGVYDRIELADRAIKSLKAAQVAEAVDVYVDKSTHGALAQENKWVVPVTNEQAATRFHATVRLGSHYVLAVGKTQNDQAKLAEVDRILRAAG